MSTLDIIIVAIIAGFGLAGFWFGLVSTLESILSTIVGAYLAFRFYAPLASVLMSFTGWTGNFPKVVMFVIAFLLINSLVKLAFWFVGKILSIVTHLPIIHSVNAILGLIFGLFEGILFIGVIFYFIGKFPLKPPFMGQVDSSRIIPYCTKTASILMPLVPGEIKSLKNAAETYIKL